MESVASTRKTALPPSREEVDPEARWRVAGRPWSDKTKVPLKEQPIGPEAMIAEDRPKAPRQEKHGM